MLGELRPCRCVLALAWAPCLRPGTPLHACALLSPAGFFIYFGYGLWHSEEASLAADQARTPDGNLDHCK